MKDENDHFEILRKIQKKPNSSQRELALETEGDSQKGDITLKYNTCLGACAQGPVININHKIIGSMTPEKISPILSEFLEDNS